ncbi:cysteine desulfurase NifS [Acetatifactor muris]|uniref:Cysteine desulfurase IscS n=1 Tax=Acetatifactor muris TaxID=879566 RepID=A0A2K4ZNC5_9FIRM|nr:cysteine desulfurase NifS [Acetatifactor muris]MCR2050240.1 cysteine desulfurase NifS [Acetatifactor muris]SOY31926.1 Cysteine desulfurase [Acetatifactor muris]
MIYLDNAATTRTAPEVVEAMLPFYTENYGNPSAVYSLGSAGKKAVNEARRTIAAAIGASQEEIYFTAGGTEADNWALKAAAESCRTKGRHIITTKIEHHAILHTCQYLEEKGYEVTYLDVDREGMVKVDKLKAAIRPDTILISVMAANNEIGTLEPVEEIGAIAREKGILFHTDAVQALGQIPLDVEALKVDMLSASAHKLNGPKGVGMLYIRGRTELLPLIHGGAQERRRRAGTENVPGIVGFGAAVRRAMERMEEKAEKERVLRDYLIKRIEEEIPCCRLNGHRERRLPGNVNFSFRFVEGEALVLTLGLKGICASSGSACTSGETDPSHVLRAIGLDDEEAGGSLRMTLSEENTREEIETAADRLKETVQKLREMNYRYKAFLKEMGKSDQ